MAEIKSHDFDRFAEKNSDLYKIVVLYGPDRGLVSERAAQLVQRTGISLDDPFSMLKLDISDLQADSGRLLDEVNSLGLFGDSKLVWLRNAGNEKPLLDALRILADAPPPANRLVIEAGDLKKGSGLRKIVEPSRAIAVIPCYADDARALNGMIDAELKAAELRISPSARQRLLDLLGGDRLASRNEIRKLCLYCRGKGVVEEQHVDEIIGDASGVSTDEAVDALLNGDLAALQRAFQKISSSKTPIFLVLQTCLKQFQMLDLMRAEMDGKNLPIGQVMMTLGRHIHFKRKPLIEKALRIWSSQALARDVERLQNAVLMSRQKQTLEPSIAFHTLMAIAIPASR